MRSENEPAEPPATCAIVPPTPFQPVVPLSNDGFAAMFPAQPPPATGFTVITRVSGVGSARLSASVTVNVTVKVPALANVTAPGFCAVELVAPPPKFQA